MAAYAVSAAKMNAIEASTDSDGEVLAESPAGLPRQELRTVIGHQRVRQGVGDRLISADPEAERLTLTA